MWIIDKDLIEDGAKNGTKSRGYTPGLCIHRFRMCDADGILYYEGRSDDNSSFDPLDDFGQPNAGCTTIRYLQDNPTLAGYGTWQVLYNGIRR